MISDIISLFTKKSYRLKHDKMLFSLAGDKNKNQKSEMQWCESRMPPKAHMLGLVFKILLEHGGILRKGLVRQPVIRCGFSPERTVGVLPLLPTPPPIARFLP